MNNNQNNELDAERKKRIVQEYLHKLMNSDPNLYYAATADVARGVHLLIKEHVNRMSVEDQALFRKITVKDIEVLLAFH